MQILAVARWRRRAPFLAINALLTLDAATVVAPSLHATDGDVHRDTLACVLSDARLHCLDGDPRPVRYMSEYGGIVIRML